MSQPPNYPPGGAQPPGGWGGQPPPQPPGGQPPGYGQQPGYGPQPGPYGQGPGQPQQHGGGSSNTLLIVVIAVLAVAAVGGGIFFLTQDDDDDDSAGGNGSDQTSGTTAPPSDDPLRQEYVDALSASLDSAELSDLGATQADAPCIAGAMVDSLGVDRLQELGTPDEVRNETAGSEPTDEELRAGLEAAFGCLDLRGLFQDEFVSRGMTEDQAGCVLGQLSDDQVEDLMSAGLDQDEAAANTLLEPAISACGG